MVSFRSFIGYSNANYALSEVQNPVRTLKRAAPLAIGLVAAVYLVVNWAYVAVVAKGDILGSGRIVAYVDLLVILVCSAFLICQTSEPCSLGICSALPQSE